MFVFERGSPWCSRDTIRCGHVSHDVKIHISLTCIAALLYLDGSVSVHANNQRNRQPQHGKELELGWESNPSSWALDILVAGLLLTWAAAGEAAHRALFNWASCPICLAPLSASPTTVAITVHAAVTGVLAARAGEGGGGVRRRAAAADPSHLGWLCLCY